MLIVKGYDEDATESEDDYSHRSLHTINPRGLGVKSRLVTDAHPVTPIKATPTFKLPKMKSWKGFSKGTTGMALDKNGNRILRGPKRKHTSGTNTPCGAQPFDPKLPLHSPATLIGEEIPILQSPTLCSPPEGAQFDFNPMQNILNANSSGLFSTTVPFVLSEAPLMEFTASENIAPENVENETMEKFVRYH
jgi:hypothetical protein